MYTLRYPLPYGIYLMHKPAGGVWSEAQILTTSMRTYGSDSMIIQDNGKPLWVWCEDDDDNTNVKYADMDPDGSWSVPGLLDEVDYCMNPMLHKDSTGVIHLMVTEPYTHAYFRRSTEGIWSATFPLDSVGIYTDLDYTINSSGQIRGGRQLPAADTSPHNCANQSHSNGHRTSGYP